MLWIKAQCKARVYYNQVKDAKKTEAVTKKQENIPVGCVPPAC